ncbi:Hsl7p [Sugiyamaella lignohabitans]|uniref:Hsl7p n=1 Tax=Sugiyamaella lignohabitans TaxID=796027 RepID=A0A167C4T6_9ASCO|nr:Hsl7p [Sugiyamaella lignohabitans]ANB11215.1 Hsl7p [Sugiyamaella lignohabitans]
MSDGTSTTSTVSMKPPLFVGVNLPAKHGVSDHLVVEAALDQGYDMVTSRLTSRSYRKRIQALFHELEMVTPSPDEHLGNQGSNNNHGAFSFSQHQASHSHSHSYPHRIFSDGADLSPYNSPSMSHSNGVNGARDTAIVSRQSSEPPIQQLPTGTLVEAEIPAPELEDVVVHPGDHVSNTIALAAPWVEIDSKNPRVANLSLQVLSHELKYATFCGLPYVIISGPKRRTNVIQYAQALNTLLMANPTLQVSIHLPLTEEFTKSATLVPPSDYLSIWEVWNTIRNTCNYPHNISVALQLPRHTLPDYVVNRWFAEPVSMIIVSSRSFVRNAKGYPVLPKSSQTVLNKFFKKNPFLIIEDPQDSTSFVGGDTAFLLYLRHLYQTSPPPSIIEGFAAGYTDYLQAPLQPLIDNLDSAMYEVFERDPIKYNQYEKAIFHALLDRPGKEVVIGVVGAGRGPLIDRVLKAASAANRTVKVLALEKNDSAYIYLLKRQAQDWGSAVQIIRGDMRTWVPPPNTPAVNILVSELLGSFGDNELSPECLDGAQRLLDPVNGITIPSSYSSHITPIFSPKLFASAWSLSAANSSGSQSGNGPATNSHSIASIRASRPGMCSADALHSPYVVMMEQVDFVSEKIIQAWTFTHPIQNMLPNNQHNVRKCKATFPVPHKTVVHGIAGYFEAVLYKDIHLSIRPDTIEAKSKDMVSWFPIWFPLSQPLVLGDDSEVDVSIWRLSDGRSVWYEWAAEGYATVTMPDTGRGTSVRRIRSGSTAFHNSGGKYSSMTL